MSIRKYIQTLLYGYLLNTDSLLCLSGERKPLNFPLIGPAVNTDTFYGPLSVRIKGI